MNPNQYTDNRKVLWIGGSYPKKSQQIQNAVWSKLPCRLSCNGRQDPGEKMNVAKELFLYSPEKNGSEKGKRDS